MRVLSRAVRARQARILRMLAAISSSAVKTEHIGSAHDDAELEVLKAVVRQCVAASQGPRPSYLCLAMAKQDSLIRGARLDRQTSASLKTAKVTGIVGALAPGEKDPGEGPVRRALRA